MESGINIASALRVYMTRKRARSYGNNEDIPRLTQVEVFDIHSRDTCGPRHLRLMLCIYQILLRA